MVLDRDTALDSAGSTFEFLIQVAIWPGDFRP